ncbi:hypothetical protein QBC44DRAFT_372270 [Cladorrhinum sp. PSN332]|nr:hypothetical protein QBC44DRAFT_372270 [Cladorrhinum sp. PSN332]
MPLGHLPPLGIQASILMPDQPQFSTTPNSPAHRPKGPTTPWGFVVYRTSYGDGALWERVKQKIEQARLKSFDAMVSESSRECAEMSTAVYREDEARLNGKTCADVRLLFNPHWGNDEEDDTDDDDSRTAREIPPPHLSKPDGAEWKELCSYACLVIDHESMLSIDNADLAAQSVWSDRNAGWVWAVDCFEDHWSNGNGWNGTWKVDICAIWSELYLRALGWDNDLIPYQIQQGEGKIWRSADY